MPREAGVFFALKTKIIAENRKNIEKSIAIYREIRYTIRKGKGKVITNDERENDMSERIYSLKVYDDSFTAPGWIFNEDCPSNSYSTEEEAENAKQRFQVEYDCWRAKQEGLTMEEYYSAEAGGKITTANIIIVANNCN